MSKDNNFKAPPSAGKPEGLLRRRRLFDEVALNVSLPPSATSRDKSESLPTYDLNLSDKIKFIFVNGRGNTGKTVFLRLNGELYLFNGQNFVLAACDIGSRSATRYFKQVITPDTNDPTEICNFIKDAILDASKTQRTLLIDMGAGGETAILALHARGQFLGPCEELGVTPVFIHLIGTSVDDVSVLGAFEDEGLLPPATALIFNEVNIGLGMDREAAFGLVRAQPCVRRAIERGVAVLRMPGLDRAIATEVEARELLFGDAIDGKVGTHKALGPLGPFDRSGLRVWRRDTLRQWSPIKTWLGWHESVDEMLR